MKTKDEKQNKQMIALLVALDKKHGRSETLARATQKQNQGQK